jgi:hypothetical protein
MAMEIGKELSWQDVAHYRLEEIEGALYLLAYPTTRILIQLFSRNRLKRIGNKMAFFCVLATEWRYNALLKFNIAILLLVLTLEHSIARWGRKQNGDGRR